MKVTPGQSLGGGDAKLPIKAPGMISRVGPVEAVQSTGNTDAEAYRNPHIPSLNTNSLSVTTGLRLPEAVRTSMAHGRYLHAATAQQPVAVLGRDAASRLGISRIHPDIRIWVGGQWFYVAGILKPAKLTPEIDAAVLVGYRPRRSTWTSTDTPHGVRTVPRNPPPRCRALGCPGAGYG
ncbi:hypothetical protein SGFS_011880 [Streptomyces graminofaciens]|uniref:MacB-like periplasmic core domain-containing protein n=1 Tax=Streptomyces graminofaciens TaxID=68212 RepID=A0ABM7F284_9ACTN|nr:hypothetical protein SGFS_011880 [Streptomyces graminofaciens]